MRLSPTSRAAAFLLVTTSASVASAQADANCPPGAWFCEETPSTAPPPELPPPTPTPPPDQPKPAPGGTTVIVPGAQPGPPPVVVYQQAPPPPPPVVIIRRSAPRYVVGPPPPPKKRYRLRKWGINMHLAGALMEDNQQDERAGMGGVGFAFRVRPQRHFALDLGLDVIGGRDYKGNRRNEVPFSISAMVYANPRSAVQFYMLGGLHWSHARVEVDEQYGTMEDYDYFGGQLGAGLEFRLSPPVALNLDLVGFVRGRTDSLAREEPEFTDPDTGQTTNTSGGGMLRAGLTFYW